MTDWTLALKQFSHTDDHARNPPWEQGPTYSNHGSEVHKSGSLVVKFDERCDTFGMPFPREDQPRSLSAVATKEGGCPSLQCPECAGVYTGQSAKSNLIRHYKQKHLGYETAFPCLHCPRVFRRSDALLKHEERKHTWTRARDKSARQAKRAPVVASSVVDKVQFSSQPNPRPIFGATVITTRCYIAPLTPSPSLLPPAPPPPQHHPQSPKYTIR